MIERAGRSDLARVAIEAALKSQAEQARRIDEQVARGAAGGVEAPKASFAGSLTDAVTAIERDVRAVDALPLDLAGGRVGDFHEVIGLLKQSELTFKFALEVRNKLIDAYRETMRMSV